MPYSNLRSKPTAITGIIAALTLGALSYIEFDSLSIKWGVSLLKYSDEALRKTALALPIHGTNRQAKVLSCYLAGADGREIERYLHVALELSSSFGFRLVHSGDFSTEDAAKLSKTLATWLEDRADSATYSTGATLLLHLGPHESALPIYRDILRSSCNVQGRENLLICALEGVASLGNTARSLRGAIISCLSNPTVKTTACATWTLASIGPSEEDLQLLTALARTEDDTVRCGALRAIGELGFGGTSALSVLEELRTHDDPLTRMEAGIALSKVADVDDHDGTVAVDLARMIDNEFLPSELYLAATYETCTAVTESDADVEILRAISRYASNAPEEVVATLKHLAANPSVTKRLSLAALETLQGAIRVEALGPPSCPGCPRSPR